MPASLQTTTRFAAAAGFSTPFDQGQFRLGAMLVPTGWTAADISFQAPDADGTYSDIYVWDGTTNTLVSIPSASITAGRWYTFDGNPAIVMVPYGLIRLKSSVNQVAARTISLALAPR